MSLIEKVSIDSIEVVKNGAIQVREVTNVLNDGLNLGQSYKRWTLEPGQNIESQTSEVQAICRTVWKPEVVASYQASLQQ